MNYVTVLFSISKSGRSGRLSIVEEKEFHINLLCREF